MKLRDFLDDKCIPYFKMNIKVKKDGKKETTDLPSAWNKKTWEQAMKWNETFAGEANAMNVVLKDSGLVVVDIDNHDKVKEILDNEGNTHLTKSTGKGLPHLWRQTNENDDHKKTNDSNVDFGDLCYLNVFESWDAEFDSGDVPTFDNYEKYFINSKTKLKVEKKKDNKQMIPKEEDRYLSKKITDEVSWILQYLPNDDFEYDEWWKVCQSVKNLHPKLKHLALKWSKKSSKHTDEDFFKYWDGNGTKYNGLNLFHLKNIFKEKNPEGFKDFQNRKLDMTPEYYSSVFMEQFANNNLHLADDGRLFIFLNGNWFEDPKHGAFKAKIREVTQYDLVNTIKDIQINDPFSLVLDHIKDQLSKLQRRGLVDDIAAFVLQTIQLNNLNLSDKVVFDVGKEQMYNLHFKNGVLELDTMTWRDRSYTDYITKGNSINMWDFKLERDEDLIKTVEEDFRKVQPDDSQRQFTLEWLAYCLTADTSATKMKFNVGVEASNGKTTEFLIHKKVFPKLVKNVDRKYFHEGNSKRHKTKVDLIQKPIRLAYIEEVDESQLEASELKDAVDGKAQNCEVMYGTNIEGSFSCKWNFLGQKEPNIKEDEGILRRGILQNYTSRFKNDVKEDDWVKFQFPRIKNFEDKYDDEAYKNAYLWLLIDNYEGANFKVPKINEENFSAHIKELNEDRELMDSFENGTDQEFLLKKDIAILISKPIGKVKAFMKEFYPNSKYLKNKMIDGHRGGYSNIKLKE